MNIEQRAVVENALRQYAAHLTESDHIAKGDKILGVKALIKSGRLRFEGNGRMIFSAPVTRKTVEKFVEGFWFWSKKP